MALTKRCPQGTHRDDAKGHIVNVNVNGDRNGDRDGGGSGVF